MSADPKGKKRPRAETDDAEAPLYVELPAAQQRQARDLIVPGAAAPSNDENAVLQHVASMIERGPRSRAASGAISSKLENKVLHLENPAKEPHKPSAGARPDHRPDVGGRNGKPMNSRQRRKVSRLISVPEDKRKYELYAPLHEMWVQYIASLVRTDKPSVYVAKLVKADFHGCILTVTQARNPSVVGITGMIIQEAESVWVLITEQDEVKVIPKAHTIFEFKVGDQPITLYGDQFCFRPGDRAARKFKTRATIAL